MYIYIYTYICIYQYTVYTVLLEAGGCRELVADAEADAGVLGALLLRCYVYCHVDCYVDCDVLLIC